MIDLIEALARADSELSAREPAVAVAVPKSSP